MIHSDKSILRIVKHNYLFLLVFILIVALRFVWLDRFPPGMQHDEVEYALSSKTYELFGTDLSGSSFPLSLFKTNTLGRISPIPPLVLAPLWKIIPLTMQTIRIMYVSLNILTSLAFGWFLLTLFKNKKIVFLGIILFLLNPWSLFLSRLAIDVAFSLLFYLVGITFLLQTYKHKYFLSFVFFMLGFFSYNGAKLLLFPIVSIILLYEFYSSGCKKKNIVSSLKYLILIFGVIVSFVLVSKALPNSILNSRSNEIVFLNNDFLSQNVDQLRNQIVHTPFTNIVVNKITFTIRFFVQNYFLAFSPQQLFFVGEFFRYHGYFYLLDLPFLLLGVLFLYKTDKKISLLLIIIALLSPIATASSLSGISILNRSFLLLPIFLAWIAYGIHYSYQLLIRNISKTLATVLLGIPYLFLFSNLLFTYFIQLPIHEHGFYQVSSRVLAKYLLLEKDHAKKIIVTSNEPRQIYLESIFFSTPEKQREL